MTQNLEKLLNAISQKIILDETAFNKFTGCGLNAREWPQFRCKEIIDGYIAVKNKSNHARAALVSAQYLNEINNCAELPDDYNLIIEEYKELMLEFRGKQLAYKINLDPKNAGKYFAEYHSLAFDDKLVHFGEVIEQTYLQTVEQSQNGNAEILIPGWENLSRMIGGFNPGRTNMLVAATGFGKTTLASNLALAAAKKMKIIYFNMEMLDFDFAQRLLLSLSDLEYKEFKFNPKQHEGRIANIMSQYLDKEFYFSRGKAMDIYEIIAKASEHKRTKGLDICFIDYDQKITLQTSRETPEWKALQIAMEQLEELAKKLEINVVLLAQESVDGGVSGSRRSMFPASSVLRFHKENNTFLIQAIKNRFGKHNAAIEVNYEQSKNRVTEIGPYDQENQMGVRPTIRDPMDEIRRKKPTRVLVPPRSIVKDD